MTNTFNLPITSSYKICVNKTNMKIHLSNYHNIFNNCSDICFIKNMKIDIYSNKCIKHVMLMDILMNMVMFVIINALKILML